MPATPRYTKLPRCGRPEHAVSDRYPFVINSKKAGYACVECEDPCTETAFLYGNPDCERRHAAKGSYRDSRARMEASWEARKAGGPDHA